MIREKCPLPPLFEKISGKWKLLILYNLSHANVLRFSDLYRSIPEVSQKVLTSQLRDLERDGLVNRKVHPEVPPRVEYSLTAKGVSLCPVLSLLADWAAKNV